MSNTNPIRKEPQPNTLGVTLKGKRLFAVTAVFCSVSGTVRTDNG